MANYDPTGFDKYRALPTQVECDLLKDKLYPLTRMSSCAPFIHGSKNSTYKTQVSFQHLGQTWYRLVQGTNTMGAHAKPRFAIFFISKGPIYVPGTCTELTLWEDSIDPDVFQDILHRRPISKAAQLELVLADRSIHDVVMSYLKQ